MTDTAESLRGHAVNCSTGSLLVGGVVIPPARSAYNENIPFSEIGAHANDGKRRQEVLVEDVAKMLVLAANKDPQISFVEKDGSTQRIVKFGGKPLVDPSDIFVRAARSESLDFRGEREVAILKAAGYKLSLPPDFFVNEIVPSTAAVFKQGVLRTTNAQLKDQGDLKRALREMKLIEKPLLNTYDSRLEKLNEYIEYMNKRCVKYWVESIMGLVRSGPINSKSGPESATDPRRWALVSGANEIDGSLQYLAVANGFYMSSRESKDKVIWTHKAKALDRITDAINLLYFGDKYPFPDKNVVGGVREVLSSARASNEANIFSAVGQLVEIIEKENLHISATAVLDVLAGIHWSGWQGTGDFTNTSHKPGFGFNGRFKSSIDGLLGR